MNEKTSIFSIAQLQANQQRPPPPRTATLTCLAGTSVGQTVKIEAAALVLGRGPEAGLRIADDGVSRQHCRLSRNAAGEVLVEDLGSTNGTFIDGQRHSRHILREGDKLQVGATTFALRFHDHIDEEFQRRQYEQATRDQLTGCYNKNYLLEQLPVALALAQRHQHRLCLLVLDLDHFKKINDTRGHLAGDKVLAAVGRKLSECLRRTDVIARFGGEEFVVVLPETDVPQATLVADKLRRAVAELAIDVGGAAQAVTVSIGVAGMNEGSGSGTAESVLAAADGHLYRAKQGGRNRVCSTSEPVV